MLLTRGIPGAVLLMGLFCGGPTAAQEVTSARLTATVAPRSSSVDVRIEYALDGTPDVPIRLEALGLGEAVVETVQVEGVGLVALEPESGAMRAGVVDVPASGRLVLRYRVPAAVGIDGPEVRVRLPVVVLDLPPATAGGAVFVTTVEIPPEWSVSETFPTMLGREGDALVGGLAVVPSFVSVRARSDGAGRPGLPRLLDGLALLVLVGVGILGWMHLRSVVREAQG